MYRKAEAITPGDAAAYGGKAAMLGLLLRAGFSLPTSFCLSFELQRRFFESVLPAEWLVAEGLPEGEERERLAERLEAATWPSSLSLALEEIHAALLKEGALSLALRPSFGHETAPERFASLRESSRRTSFAPLFLASEETPPFSPHLHLTSLEALKAAIQSLWAEAIRAASPDEGAPWPSIGFIIQPFLDAEVSGTATSQSPYSGDSREVWVRAAWGVASPWALPPASLDLWRLLRDEGSVFDESLAPKPWRYAPRAEGGVVFLPNAADKAQKACLSPPQLLSLTRLVQDIEAYVGDAGELHWAYAGARPFILDFRPLPRATASSERGASRRRIGSAIGLPRTWLWRRLQGGASHESLSPLACSLIENIADPSLRRAFAKMGLASEVPERLLGHLRGHLCLDHGFVAQTLAELAGVPEGYVHALLSGHIPSREADEEEGAPLVLPARWDRVRWLRRMRRLNLRAQELTSAVEESAHRVGRLDFRLLTRVTVENVWADAERLMERTVELWGHAEVLLAWAALRLMEQMQRSHGSQKGLQDFWVLLSSLHDPRVEELLESRAPLLPRAHFASFLEPAASLAEAQRSEESGTLKWAWATASRLVQSPERSITLAARFARRRALLDHVRVAEYRLPFKRRTQMRTMRLAIQHAWRLRNQVALAFFTEFALLRRLCVDLSRRIQRHYGGEHAAAAWHLNLQEIRAFLRRVPSTSMRGLLAAREREWEGAARATTSLPELFLSPPIRPFDTLPALQAAEAPQQGVGIVPGVVCGSAWTADSTQPLAPGMIVLLPELRLELLPKLDQAGAIVLESAALLSPTSALLRELALPAVVAVQGICSRVRPGDWLQVDGEKGEVQISKAPG